MTRPPTNPGRNGTAPIIYGERARRETWQWGRPMKVASFIILLCGAVLTAGALLWKAATMAAQLDQKADKATVREIRTDVEVIKTRQEMFIKAVRPKLLKE